MNVLGTRDRVTAEEDGAPPEYQPGGSAGNDEEAGYQPASPCRAIRTYTPVKERKTLMTNSGTTATAPSTPTDQLAKGTRLTPQAAAVYLARLLHDKALATSNPAATLDDIADGLPEVMPGVFADMGTAPDLAAVLLPEVSDRIWAFTVVAHARAEVGDDYGYVLDILADNVRNGRDPQAVRDEVPRVVAKIRASRITARIWEARDAADGSWAKILDIVLETIEEGADPQAVIDQVVDLMRQSIDARKAAA